MNRPDSLWRHRSFQQLFWAHTLSILGGGLTSVALGLLVHHMVGTSASSVMGVMLAIRVMVIVLCSPWAGKFADRFGARNVMIASDLVHAVAVMGFFFVDAVWQIYALAVVINLGSAIFTPIYRSVIPGMVSPDQYPRALAICSMAYDAANILGPTLAACVIALLGFQANFIADGVTLLASAALLLGLPRMWFDGAKPADASFSSKDGIAAVLTRKPMRESLILAFMISLSGAFVFVATIDFIKNELALSDQAYAWAMTSFGLGSLTGAFFYAKAVRMRDRISACCGPLMIGSLIFVALCPAYFAVLIAWFFVGAAYSTLGIRSTECLAVHSTVEERSHIYAAHFALSHVGWGLTSPLAGFLTTALGFGKTAWVFAVVLLCVAAAAWVCGRKGKRSVS